jgi:Tol biopolymer transport system component
MLRPLLITGRSSLGPVRFVLIVGLLFITFLITWRLTSSAQEQKNIADRGLLVRETVLLQHDLNFALYGVVTVSLPSGWRFDGNGNSTPVLSPDSSTLAYVTQRKSGMMVVVGKTEGKIYSYITKGSLQFSADGKHIVYIASKDEKRKFVVLDGKEDKEYDGIGNLLFSADGKKLAYVAAVGGKQLVVVNGAEGKPFDAIGENTIVFSPNSEGVAYVAIRGDKNIVVVNGVEQKEYKRLPGEPPIFSEDGKHIAYRAEAGVNRFIVLDGIEGKAYDGVTRPIFSLNGKRFVYMAMKDNKFFLVVDGKEDRSYTPAGGVPSFSPDSKHVAFTANINGKYAVVVDGSATDTYNLLTPLLWSPDSKQYAYWATQNGRDGFVIQNKMNGRGTFPLQNKTPQKTVNGVAVLRFSLDGQRFAYSAGRGDKWFMVIDGIESQAYDAVHKDSPVFSQDGKHVCYAVEQNNKWSLIVDGLRVKDYSGDFVGAPVFSGNIIRAIVYDKISYTRVEVDINNIHL